MYVYIYICVCMYIYVCVCMYSSRYVLSKLLDVKCKLICSHMK